MTESAVPGDAQNPRAREDAVFRSLGREWVIYDPRTQLLHVLNTTAALVWSFCDGSRSPEEIAGDLTEVLTDLPSEDLVVDQVRGGRSRDSESRACSGERALLCEPARLLESNRRV